MLTKPGLLPALLGVKSYPAVKRIRRYIWDANRFNGQAWRIIIVNGPGESTVVGKSHKIVRAILVFLLCGASALIAGPYSTWSHYRYVTVNTTGSGANVATSQTNFPLLVRLNNSSTSSGSDVLSGALAGGADVRFTDSAGAVALSYQIERWTTSNAEIWLNVPTVTGNSTTTVRMYWGQSGQTDGSNGSAVFDTGNNFRAVWHMNGSSATSNEADATEDGYTATEMNSPGAQNTGAIGYSRTLNNFQVTSPSTAGFSTSNALSFADVNNGWAVGASGSILNTSNGGSSWTPQTSGITANLYGVAFANDNVGIAVGAGGTILITSNGGETWTAATSGTTNDLNAVAFSPGRADTALAVGVGGTILKTINGGSSWTLYSSGKTDTLNAVAFNTVSHQVAFAVGDSGVIVKSANLTSTNTWSSVGSLGTAADFYSVAFVPDPSSGSNPNIAYAVGASGMIKKTTSGGTGTSNWTTIATTFIGGTPTVNLTGVYCTENNVGWIVGANGSLYRTSLDTSAASNATRWAPIASGTSQNLTAVQFVINNGVGFAIGANNTFLQINYATGQYFDAIGTGSAPVGTGINFNSFANYTISAWANLDANDSTYHLIASKSDFQYSLQTDPAAKWEFTEFDNATSGSFTSTGYNQVLSTANAPTGWHYLAGVHNGNNPSTLYLDGALVGSTITNVGNASARVTSNDLDIGRSPDASAPLYRYWIGAIDELEISSTSRSSDWIRLSYQTQRTDSVFVALGNSMTYPGAPVGVTDSAGNALVKVSWSPPASNGGLAITGYTVTSVQDTSKHCSTAGALTCIVSGLTNGTSYSFTVTATNSLGTGPASSTPNTATPATVPGAPTGVVATGGNAQATLVWAAPPSNGGSAITSYLVTSVQDTSKHCSTATLSCTVSGLTNGTSYSFTVTASNSAGAGPASSSNSVIPATVPGAPVGVTDSAGNTQVTVSWAPPASNGGSPITGYTVTAVQDTSKHCSTATLSCVVLGLTNGTAYTFTVTASNSVGAGPATSQTNPVMPATVPGAPTNVTDTAGNAEVTVTWSPPASNGGSTIMGYTVTSVQDSSKHCTTTAALSCQVVGLTNGTSYTFTVTAMNAVGVGSPSAATSPAVTPLAPIKAPGPPLSVTAKAGKGRDTVSWLPPTSDSGSAVTLYTVTSNPDGKICTTNGALTCVDSGLTGGTSYSFTVTATNTAGTSIASAPSTGVVALGIPGAPAIVSAVPGNALVTVTWTAPSNTGGATITLYTASAVTSPGGVASGTPCTWSTGPLSCNVTGLTNGTSYTISVTATNSVGVSPASPASAAVIPITVPGAPAAVMVQGAPGQVTVSWTAPSNGGSAITGYKVTAVQDTSKHCVTTTAVTCAVTGLTNTTSYNFLVVATNAAGTGPADTSKAVTHLFDFTSKGGFNLRMTGSSLLLSMPEITGDVRVSILDIWGRTLWNRTVSGNIGQLSWNGNSNYGASTPAGVYILRLTLLNDDKNPTDGVIQTRFFKP